MQVGGLVTDNVSMRVDHPGGGNIHALKDVNLAINSGELMSVFSPSGCGKTTLLNIVPGFLAPTEGRIRLNDQTISGPGRI